MSPETVRLRLSWMLELGRLGYKHEGIDGRKVGWFEQAAALEKLAGVEATGNQRL